MNSQLILPSLLLEIIIGLNEHTSSDVELSVKEIPAQCRKPTVQYMFLYSFEHCLYNSESISLFNDSLTLLIGKSIEASRK